MASVTIRYARALADVIADSGLDAVETAEQLCSLVEAFEESPDLRQVWESPAISVEEKLRLLDAILGRTGITARPLRNFMAVLIEKDRIALLPDIVQQLHLELNSRSGRVDAEIVSARELAPAQREVLLNELARLTGKQVAPHYSTDPHLLGGVKVRVGSTVYDGTVRGQLQRIRQQLAES